MKKFFLMAFAILLSYCVNAQVLIGTSHQALDTSKRIVVATPQPYQYPHPNDKPYTWGIGVKYQPAALSVKWYSKSGDALEVLFSRFSHGSRGTALLELSPGLNSNGKFRFLAGPGIHLSVIERAYFFTRETKNPVFGGDGIIGFELIAPKAHLAFQIDFQPSFDFNGNNDSYTDWGGLTIRYVW